MDLERKDVGLGDRTALLLVDMIEGFTNPECPLGCDCPEVVAVNIELLRIFRLHDLPVYFTSVVYRNNEQARIFRDRIPALNVLAAGSRWVEVDSRLQKRPNDVLIEKQYASAFHDTELDLLLKADSVDSLVITGLTTSGCVRATAVDAMQHDYRVVVAKDAVGDRNPEAHEANLFDLHAKYADVWLTKDIVEALTDR